MNAAKAQRLERLRTDVERYNARWVAGGGKLTLYQCPACHQTIERTQPSVKHVGDRGYWDSMTTCVHCGELHFVKVFPDGRVDVERADSPAPSPEPQPCK